MKHKLGTKQNRRTSRAVLAHDGQEWFLFVFGGGSTATAAPLFHERQSGQHDRIPSEFLQAAATRGARSARLLLAGEVRRLEIALPPRFGYNEANALLANEIADLSGADSDSLLCAGAPSDALGAKRGAALAGCFERAMVLALREQILDAGLAFDGVASLELACLAAWRAANGERAETLMLVGQAHTFVIPSRALADSPAPISVSGGARHIASDPDAWSLRLQRGTRFLEKANAVHMLVMSSDSAAAENVVRGVAGFPPIHAVARESLYEAAAQTAVAARANSLKSAVPVANPYIPRKRFSHAVIALICLPILALPFCYLQSAGQRLKTGTKLYNAEAAQYLPLERKVKDATKQRNDLQAAYQREQAVQQTLAERRKPLAAFIHMSYFFSKFAGDTVLLDSIIDAGGTLRISGVYSDPEDGLALNADLNKFCAEKGLAIVENKLSDERDSEGAMHSRVEIAVDYRNVK